MTAPATKVRKCFALARSTTHAGEREAALSRGMAILERAGLAPDAFDIPGRVRPERKPQPYATFHEFGTARRARSQRPFFNDSPAEQDAQDFVRAFKEGLDSVAYGGFNMDDLMWEAVKEAVKRRRNRKP